MIRLLMRMLPSGLRLLVYYNVLRSLAQIWLGRKTKFGKSFKLFPARRRW